MVTVKTVRNHNHRRASQRHIGRAVMEALEERTLFSLLGVLPGLPQISVVGSDGSMTYSATTHALDASATPTSMTLTDVFPPQIASVGSPADFELHVTVDNSGNVSSGSQANDLVVTGSVDVNGDGVADYTGVLLTGKVEQMGSLDSGTNDDFDFRFAVTGGALAATYFSGKDIGVLLTTENSTFNGTFASDFSALVKGSVGPIDPLGGSLPILISGHKYQDMTGNGLSSDDMSHPLSGVTIQLYKDTDSNGVLDSGDTLVTSQVTGSNGAYAFTGLSAATYFVKEVQKSGYIETAPASGLYTVNATSGAYTGLDFDNYKSTCGCGCGCGSTLLTAKGSLEGTVFNDKDGDGHFDRNEGGISGVKITLTGTDLLGNKITKTMTTDCHGDYSFNGLIAGNYTITETQPTGYTDGKDQVGTLGGTLGNDVISNITLPPCGDGECYNFGEQKTTSVCGNSGHGCCTVVLTGCDQWGRQVCYTATTDCHGNYSFGNLCGGNWQVTECDSHNRYTGYGKSFFLSSSCDQGKNYDLDKWCGSHNCNSGGK